MSKLRVCAGTLRTTSRRCVARAELVLVRLYVYHTKSTALRSMPCHRCCCVADHSRSWLQAGRVWRDGQKKRVYVYRLLATGTIEEKVTPSLSCMLTLTMHIKQSYPHCGP